MEKLTRVYLGLGSNEGDRINYLQQARNLISEEIGAIKAISSIYETPPFGFESVTNFYNQCLSVDTKLNPFELLAVSQTIEIQLGRTQKSEAGTYNSRTIDLDILFFGTEIIHYSNLVIPHNQLTHRKFVLEPLNEIAPDHVHPVTHLTVSQLLNNCFDVSDIVKIH